MLPVVAFCLKNINALGKWSQPPEMAADKCISAKCQRSVRLSVLFKHVQQRDRSNGEMELQYLSTDLKRSILCSDNHVFLPPLAGNVIRIQKCFYTDIAEPSNSYRGLKHKLKYFVPLLVVKHYYLVHSLWRIAILNTASHAHLPSTKIRFLKTYAITAITGSPKINHNKVYRNSDIATENVA